MEALKNAAAQAQRVWQQSSRGNQIAIVLLAMASIGAVAGVGIWSSQPQYVPLASGLTFAESRQLGASLEGAGIEFKLNYDGSVVSVPTADFDEAIKAAGDKIPDQYGAEPPTGGSFGELPGDARERRLREKAQRLARSIAVAPAIKHADVHISNNEAGPFVSMGNESASAAVILTIAKGHSVGRNQADNIAHMIANSLKGVSIEDVSVTDQNQRNLRAGGGISDEKLSQQLEYVSRLEARARDKIESQLTQFLGQDKAIVSVTKVVDFKELEIVNKTYDPDGKVLLDEDTMSESGTSLTLGGRTGVPANTGAGTRTNKASPSKRETAKNSYLVPETIETTSSAPGVVQRMTIAATVDLSGLKDESGKPRFTTDDIKELIKGAVAFDESRNDVIQVIDAPLATVEAEPTEATPAGGLDSYTGLLQNLSLGLASILAFVFGFMTLKRFKPIAVPAPTAATVRKDQLVGEISAKAEDDPEAVSRIVAAWLNEPAPGGTTAAGPAEAGEAARAAA